MTANVYSVEETSRGLTEALHQYLEAQYHIWDESLLRERRRLLESPGTTTQVPALEATPFYATEASFSALDIPNVAREVLIRACEIPGVGIYPTPFHHQGKALECFLGENRDMVVATGTGSGKTESFLMPILGELAIEFAERKASAQVPGCRALLLYPMNALVNDQLARLRRLFGNPTLAAEFRSRFGRHPIFGTYTSRTPYPGTWSKSRDEERLARLFENLYRGISAPKQALLEKEGKWPAKDMQEFERNQYTTSPLDRELFTRHEMQRRCPDLLVTNYSMLEYMLLRPIEAPIFEQTAVWLARSPANRLIVVLDEAHMYRGSAGAEVAFLLRRLRSRLGVDRQRLRFILTSASLGSSEDAERALTKFAEELTGGRGTSAGFALIRGKFESVKAADKASQKETLALSKFPFRTLQSAVFDLNSAKIALQELAAELGVTANVDAKDAQELQAQVFRLLETFSPAGLLTKLITANPMSFNDVADRIFNTEQSGKTALEALIALAVFARRGLDGRVFLPIRLHLFYRGLSGLYACTNRNCSGRLDANNPSYLGKLFDGPRLSCDCGSRVYELLTHRDCGAAFIRGYLRNETGSFLWHEPSRLASHDGADLIEAHFLVETARDRARDAARVWLHRATGQIRRTRPDDLSAFIELLQPGTILDRGRPLISFDKECPVCLRQWRGDTKIMDLATRGEAPFAYLVRTQVRFQPATKARTAEFPNAGRKSLLFSDGRQKAARLARDIPREVERDVARQLILAAAKELIAIGREPRLDPAVLYTAFLHVLASSHINLLDGEDNRHLRQHILDYKSDYQGDLRAALEYNFSRRPPLQYVVHLLRQLGSQFYSVSALTLAYVVPTDRAFAQVKRACSHLEAIDLAALSALWINTFLERFAFDKETAPGVRASAAGYITPVWGVPTGFPKRREAVVNSIFGDSAAINAAFLEALAVSDNNGLYFLSPDKTKLELATQKPWVQCNECSNVFPVHLRVHCVNCGSENITQVAPDESVYLRARKTFWRDPVVKVLNGTEEPFNISVEEHTAQLSYRDLDDPGSTTEEFERRFRDILIHRDDTPVDVLSSTTTMEVGIDIGSLVAVGLRNVPPMRQNYQQRAGRAGRRGSSVSTVVTFAQNGPYDNYYFEHPAQIISGDPPFPTIDASNIRIIKRHVNAVLLQAFFHERAAGLPRASNVFSVLGYTWEFYSGHDERSFEAFQLWLKGIGKAAETLESITEWLPESIKASATHLAREFVAALRDVRPSSKEQIDGQAEYLIEFLFAEGLLPSYAFPRDLCAVQIEDLIFDQAQRRYRVKVLERPQQNLGVALSEYAPGRLVVVNKKTYRVGSIAASTSAGVEDRATRLFAESRRYIYCPDCLYMQPHWDQYQQGSACNLCGGPNVRLVEVVQPEIVYPEGRREIDELDDEQTFSTVTSAQLPSIENEESLVWKPLGQHGQITSAVNQRLVTMNKGEDSTAGGSGFMVCERCGYAAVAKPNIPLPAPHRRNYFIEPRPGAPRTSDSCNGTFRPVFIGYTFPTDILLFRVSLRPPLNTSITRRLTRRPLEDGLLSLCEALALASCRRLDIDARELNSGFRFVRVAGESVADIFLYDTLSGGAGYAHMAAREFDRILKETEEDLRNCQCQMSCDKCLRHYGNRAFHTRLDRFLALDLLRYLSRGEVPEIKQVSEQAHELSNLRHMLNLEGWKTSEASEFPLEVRSDSGICRLGTYPALIDPDAVPHPLLGKALLLSTYELKNDLPSAFARVSAQ